MKTKIICALLLCYSLMAEAVVVMARPVMIPVRAPVAIARPVTPSYSKPVTVVPSPVIIPPTVRNKCSDNPPKCSK